MRKEKNETNVTDICDINIRRTGTEADRSAEKRSAHIYEKMRVFSASRQDSQFDKLPENFVKLMQRSENGMPPGAVFTKRLSLAKRTGFIADCAEAACYLREAAGYKSIPSLYLKTDTEPPSGGRITYFKNALADEAFSEFSKKTGSAEVSYAQDLNSVCEAVYYERSPYGILPLSNTKDGRLSGFYGLLDKYELYAVASCEVISRENEVATRFALLSKHPCADGDVTGKRLYLEIRIPHTSDGILAVLLASAYYGLENTGIDGLPADIKSADVVSLCGRGEDICDLLFFMYCLDLQYTLVGVYEI